METPKEGDEAYTQNTKLETELNQRQKVYSTREMCRDFIQQYTRLNHAKFHSKAILRNMYKSLTGDFHVHDLLLRKRRVRELQSLQKKRLSLMNQMFCWT